MLAIEPLETVFVVTAFLFQVVLILHFAMRKWRFRTALRYGPVVYALSIPAAVVSVLLLTGGLSWSFVLAGFLFLIWALFGYIVEYGKKIEWRKSLRWPIFIPYILLYLATVMFYWFPLALIDRALWTAYAVLFAASTILNLTSHNDPGERSSLPV